jgi:hypothetical protein
MDCRNLTKAGVLDAGRVITDVPPEQYIRKNSGEKGTTRNRMKSLLKN